MSRDFDGANTGNRRMVKELTWSQVWDNYERIPPPIRQVLQETAFNMDEEEIVGLIQEGRSVGYSLPQIVSTLKRLIAQDVAANAVDWGPGYPRIPFKPLEPKPHRSPRRTRRIL